MVVELLTYSIRLTQPMSVIVILGTDLLSIGSEQRDSGAQGVSPYFVVKLYTTHRADPFEIDMREIDLAAHRTWTNDATGTQACVDELSPYVRLDPVITPALPSVKNSIEYESGALQLVGDTGAPGNNKVYGTDGSGARGWKDDPAALSDGDKGDITVSGAGAAWAIDPGVVTNAKRANMAAATLSGRAAGAGTGAPQDLTANQASTLLDSATDPFLRTSALPAAGDVSGPGSAVDDDIALFDGATGKLIKSAGINLTEIIEGSGFGDVSLIDSTATSPIVLKDAKDGDGTTVQSNTGSFQVNVNAKNSVEVDAGQVQLVGDSAAPGNSKYYGTDSSGTQGYHSLPSSDATGRAVNQVAHGFAVGDVIYHNGSAFAKAQANASATAEAVGIVSAVADSDNFTYTSHGYVTGLSGLTAGTVYFLSDSTAGAVTATAPTTTGYIRKAQLIALSTTTAHYNNFTGYTIA